MATEVNLLIYVTASEQSLVAAFAAIKKNTDDGNTLTLKDLTGIATGDVDTWIGTLVADTYDHIYIAAPCEATSNSTGTGTINCTQQYTLLAKLKTASQGTLSTLIENADTHTATTIGLAATTDWTAHEFIGEHVVITAGTGSGQLSEVKDNTATVATIRGTFYAAPDATSDFKTLVGANLHLWGKIHTNTLYTATKSVSELAWDDLYPNLSHDLLSSALSGDGNYSRITAGCSAIGATSLTDSNAPFVASALIGKYVQIYSATTNGYQYALITANSTTVLTVSGWNLGLTPTGTPTYKVVDSLSAVYKDLFVKYFVLTYMADPTSSVSKDTYNRLVDQWGTNGSVPSGRAPKGDWDYFAGTVLGRGKTIFDALRLSVTA